MRREIGKVLFVAISAIALMARMGMAQDPPSHLTTNGYFDNHINLDWWPPGQTGSELTVGHWSGAMTNANAHWNGGDCWAITVDPHAIGQYELWEIHIYILSETDPYWPWPNNIHEPLIVKAWADNGSGQPGTEIYSHQNGLSNPSSTSWLIDELATPVTCTGTIFVGNQQIQANPNAEGMGVDPALNFPALNWYRIAGVWSSNIALSGDLMFEALVFGEFGNGLEARWVGPQGSRPANVEINPSKVQPPVALAHEGPLPEFWAQFHPSQPAPHSGIHHFPGTDVLSYYKIYRNGTYYAQTAGVVENYDDFGIVEGVQYSYTVSALYIPEGESVQTDPATGTANMPPGAPTNLVGTSNQLTTMTLTWTDPAVNANGTPCGDLAGLRVYRNAALIATVNPGIQTYVDTPPEPTAIYTWSVTGIDEVPNEGAAAQFTGAVISPWQVIPIAWVEINTVGTNTGLTGDDQVLGPFRFSFDFSHYGNAYNQVYVSSNGNLQFTTPTSTVYSNTTIPNVALPNNALYPFWDDLYLPTGGHVWYYDDVANNRFIVEYEAVPHISGAGSGGPFTFEVILHSDGTMEYQYLTMGAGTFSATIGIENLAGTLAEQIQYNNTGPFMPNPFANVAVGWFMGGGGPPNVTVTLLPVNPPIIIPPTGGEFSWDITLHNGEATPQTIDIWNIMSGPATRPGWSFMDLTMPAGVTINRIRPQYVSDRFPAGAYTYTSNIGEYPSTVWDSDSFPYTKAAAGADGWAIGQSTTATPAEYAVHGASPNPFNPTTTLSFALPQAGPVKLSVYNVTGREVATLVNGWRDAGNHEVTFDATGLASGLYVYQLTAGDFHASGKMVLTK